jgi:hypothetical protein
LMDSIDPERSSNTAMSECWGSVMGTPYVDGTQHFQATRGH